MQRVAKLQQKLQKAREQEPADAAEIEQLQAQLAQASKRAAKTLKIAAKSEKQTEEAPALESSNDELPAIIKQAFLRTLSRYPDDEELRRAERSYHELGDVAAGTRDLLWALLNTKEFVLNH